MEIISRKNAKKAGLTRYFTGKPCPYGHISERYVSSFNCIECASMKFEAWKLENKERLQERNKVKSKEWRDENPDKVQDYRKKNKEKLKEDTYRWRKENPERYKEHQRQSHARNKDERNAKRREKYAEDEEYREKCNNWGKNWYENNKDRAREVNKQWHEDNPDWKKEYYYKNREERLEWTANWRKNTPQGQLWREVQDTAKSLKLGKVPFSKTELIPYAPEEYVAHLLKDTEFDTLDDAFKAGYHVDHIVPISFIAKNIKDKKLRLLVAMDLENLRLIDGTENMIKSAKLDLPIVQNTVMVLSAKYDLKGLTNGCS